MSRLTAEERARAFGMMEAGMSIRNVARHFGVAFSTAREIRNRYAETRSFRDRPRSGRPRVTTPQQDRHVVLSHLRNRFRPVTSTAAITIGTHTRPINGHIVCRRLRERQIQARRPARGPILTIRNSQNCLQWAQNHLRWTRARWSDILFSDESLFCCSIADGRRRV